MLVIFELSFKSLFEKQFEYSLSLYFEYKYLTLNLKFLEMLYDVIKCIKNHYKMWKYYIRPHLFTQKHFQGNKVYPSAKCRQRVHPGINTNGIKQHCINANRRNINRITFDSGQHSSSYCDNIKIPNVHNS